MIEGLEAADRAGLAVKINAVALKGVNDGELGDMLQWCGDRGYDMTVIEVMPMGDIGGENRVDQYLPLSLVLSWLEQKAVAVLLTLLHLGVRNIRLGPSLPAFLTPAVVQVLVDTFGLTPIGEPQADLDAMLTAA